MEVSPPRPSSDVTEKEVITTNAAFFDKLSELMDEGHDVDVIFAIIRALGQSIDDDIRKAMH